MNAKRYNRGHFTKMNKLFKSTKCGVESYGQSLEQWYTRFREALKVSQYTVWEPLVGDTDRGDREVVQ